jgi:hypothetical protein
MSSVAVGKGNFLLGDEFNLSGLFFCSKVLGGSAAAVSLAALTVGALSAVPADFSTATILPAPFNFTCL